MMMTRSYTPQNEQQDTLRSGAAVLGLGAMGAMLLVGAFIVGSGIIGLAMILGSIASLLGQVFFGIDYVSKHHQQTLSMMTEQHQSHYERVVDDMEWKALV